MIPVAAAAGIWAALVSAVAEGSFLAHVWIFSIKLSVRLALFMIKVGALLIIIGVIGQGVQEALESFNLVLPPMLEDGISRILPGNFILCLSAIITAKLLVFTFAVSSRLISLFLSDF
ncbi:hypothetical protein GCM10027040_05250 [Halomonas shantousis]